MLISFINHKEKGRKDIRKKTPLNQSAVFITVPCDSLRRWSCPKLWRVEVFFSGGSFPLEFPPERDFCPLVSSQRRLAGLDDFSFASLGGM